jgi:TP901-1 family phage major tail protein
MAKVKGVDIYVKVNTGTYETPVWTKVGGQKDASITFGLGDIDITDKDSAGWEENLPGNRNVEIEFDAFLIEDDAGFVEMKKGFWEATPKDLDLQLVTPAKTYRGYFRLTEMPFEAPLDDAATVSFSLKLTGALQET